VQSPDEYVESFTHDTKIKLLRRGTEYLYSLPTKPITFESNEEVGGSCFGKHHWKIQEHRYGKAMMITKICIFCLHGEIEILPPNENRNVVVNG